MELFFLKEIRNLKGLLFHVASQIAGLMYSCIVGSGGNRLGSGCRSRGNRGVRPCSHSGLHRLHRRLLGLHTELGAEFVLRLLLGLVIQSGGNNGTLAGKGTHAELLRTCDTYREIYFSQFPEERSRYASVSAGNIRKEVTV